MIAPQPLDLAHYRQLRHGAQLAPVLEPGPQITAEDVAVAWAAWERANAEAESAWALVDAVSLNAALAETQAQELRERWERLRRQVGFRRTR